MRKTKILLVSLLAVVVVAACAMFAACGGKKYNVTWDVEKATVTVEGYTELPAEVKEGDIVFTVKPDDGYEMDTVLNGSTQVKADKDGKYTVSVSADVTISVKVKRTIGSVEVTTNPTKMTYVAGESFNKAGMVVTVNYKNGEKETVDNYSVKPSTFSAGDTSFTVTYSGVTSEAVNLDETVQGVIVLDPVGGTVASDVVSALQAREDLTSVVVGDKGVITIKYTALTAAIALPKAEQVTKGVEGEYNYVGWKTVVGEEEEAESVTEIAADYKGSYNLALKWDANILTINSLKFVYTTINDVEGPYLVINANFNTTDSAYLYLYEGNDKVELKGDTYTRDASKENQDLYFYLPTLGEYQDGGYNGKWMDVCFNAVIDGVEYSQSFPLDHDAPIAQVGPTVQDSVNTYTLLTYRSNGVDYIKLAFKPYTSTYGFAFDGDKMTVSGKINTESATFKDKGYAGGTASLTLGQSEKSGTINADGTWAIEFSIEEIGLVAAGVMPSISFTDKDGEQLTSFAPSYTAGTTAYDYDGGKFGNPSYYSLRHINGDYAVFVGNMGSDWQNALFAVLDRNAMVISTTGAKLEAGKTTVSKPDPDNEEATIEEEIDCAYLVFTGNLKYYVDDSPVENAELETLTSAFTEYSVQNDDGWAYLNGCSDSDKKAANTVFVLHEDGTFEVKIALNGAPDGSFWYLHYCHTGRSNGDLSRSNLKTIDETTVTVGNQTFSFYDTTSAAPEGHNSWLQGRLLVHVEAAAE